VIQAVVLILAMVLARAPAILATALSLLACFQSSSVTAGPIVRRSDLAVKDYHPAPRAWANLGRAPGHHLIQLTIGLSQSRFSELERHLYEGTTESYTEATT
jgi:tripeptidyl-peptidase-1